MRRLIQNGRVIDPSQKMDCIADILIQDGMITKIGQGLAVEGAEVVDASGLIVTPGLIDMHCHLREPGYEYKETIATGTRAAARGGYTAVACMANTSPVNDNAAVTMEILDKARREGAVRVYPIGAVTKGLAGKELTEMQELQQAGCVALSDDGKPVADPRRMYLALQYASGFNMLIISHCEDAQLVNDGVMHEGYMSMILGLKGINRAAEEVMVSRDILLAESLGTKVHLAHLSTKGSVQLVRDAKKRGVKVTCETCPHYIAGTDSMVEGYDTGTKVNPPLRSEEDRRAIIQGLVDGTIDCIATDHAPHHIDDKLCEYQVAAFGIAGLETAFALCYTHLVLPGHMDLFRLITLMSTAPAGVLGVQGGSLQAGKPADIACFETEREYAISVADFVSKGKNNPFDGKKVHGRPVHVLVQGESVLLDGKL